MGHRDYSQERDLKKDFTQFSGKLLTLRSKDSYYVLGFTTALLSTHKQTP